MCIAIVATDVQAREWIHEFASPFKKLMSCCKCAMMEAETKFSVLNENFSISNDSNHIESIIGKMVRNNFPLTPDV